MSATLDLDRLDFDADFFQPGDRFLDLVAFAAQGKGDESDFVRHAGLPDIGDDLELFPQFPNDGARNETRREHQPQAGFVFHLGKLRVIS